MPDITPTIAGEIDRNIFWETLTENDTALAADWPGGEGFMSVFGTFGSATCNIEISIDDGVTYFTPDTDLAPNGLSFTADGMVKFDLPPCKLRPAATGGTSQDLDIKLQPKRYV